MFRVSAPDRRGAGARPGGCGVPAHLDGAVLPENASLDVPDTGPALEPSATAFRQPSAQRSAPGTSRDGTAAGSRESCGIRRVVGVPSLNTGHLGFRCLGRPSEKTLYYKDVPKRG